MNDINKALLELVGTGASGSCSFSEVLYKADWNILIKLAAEHGVTSVCMNALLVLHRHNVDLCSTEQKLQLYARSQQVSKTMQERNNTISEFANLVKPLPVVALKGADYAAFLPNPLWREYGDLDCSLADGDCQERDKVAVEKGCQFENGGYKHYHLFYKGLMIENHHKFTLYHGSDAAKLLERELSQLFKGEFTPIPNLISSRQILTSRQYS